MSDFKDKKTNKNKSKSKILEFKTKSLKEQKIETTRYLEQNGFVRQRTC